MSHIISFSLPVNLGMQISPQIFSSVFLQGSKVPYNNHMSGQQYILIVTLLLNI